MIHLKTFTFNPFQENTYVVYDDEGEGIVIDPGCYTYEERQEFKKFIEENNIQLKATRKDVAGDLTLLVFPLAKLMQCSPLEAGERIGALIQSEVPEVSEVATVNGFLNITFSENYWIQQLSLVQDDPNFGFVPPKSKATVMVEYSSPNTNKPLHLGHLRNNFLGFSVAEILKASGFNVVKTQVINDRGIHICKSMLAWEKFSPLNAKGERETPANTGWKGDKLVGKYYVAFDKHFNAEAASIIEQWDANNFEFGAFPTDINGDGNVDNADYLIWETNANNFIFSVFWRILF